MSANRIAVLRREVLKCVVCVPRGFLIRFVLSPLALITIVAVKMCSLEVAELNASMASNMERGNTQGAQEILNLWKTKNEELQRHEGYIQFMESSEQNYEKQVRFV